jgi:endoglucanase
MFQPFTARLPRAALGGAAVLLAALGTVAWAGAARGAPTPFASAGGLYIDPTSQVMRWVAANPNDSRTPVIRDRIASQPQARWFSAFNIGTIQQEVAGYVGGATDGSVPVLVSYGIPNRDCGGASAGGAPDLASYGTWINNFAHGLGSSNAIVILEPDSLALQTCLSGAQVTARDNALAAAVQTFRSTAPNAKVYLDAGHSAWNSAGDQAARLRAAGVTSAAGIFTNVSNFNPTSNETNFASAVLSAIGNPALRAVIDTSRNGNGSNGEWCDPAGRAIGPSPARQPGGSALVDAFLWVKPPGEADGCAAAAGTFVPALAFALAGSGTLPPVTAPPATTPPVTAPPATTPPGTTPPVTTPPATTPPVTPPAGSGCTVTYHLDSSWDTGFTATVTIRNDGPAVSNWTLAFGFPGNQRISTLWNGVLTSPPGASVTVTNASHNGSLATGGTANFGFQASYSGSNGPPAGFTLSGRACATA